MGLLMKEITTCSDKSPKGRAISEKCLSAKQQQSEPFLKKLESVFFKIQFYQGDSSEEKCKFFKLGQQSKDRSSQLSFLPVC
jgi:hypothetical protein